MCFPLVAAQLGGTALGALATMGAQQQTFDAEAQRYTQNYNDALADNRVTEDRLQEREMEENASYVQKDQLALNEGAQKQAQVRAAAGAGGVTGTGVQDVVNAIGTQINAKRATLNQQWTSSIGQTQSEKLTGVNQEEARMGEVAPPTSPNFAGTLLGAAGQGLSTAGTPSGQAFFNGIGSTVSSASAGLTTGFGLNGATNQP